MGGNAPEQEFEHAMGVLDGADRHRSVVNSRSKQTTRVSTAIPFAGRIGGNQQFAISPSDPVSQNLAKKTPDAAPLHNLRDALDLQGFGQPIIWKAAFIEGWGMAVLVYVNGTITIALGNKAEAYPLAVPVLGAFWNWVAITMFVYSCGPASGGHVNPLITMATFTAGLSTFPRTLLYVVSQCVGAICGAFLLKLGLGGDNYFPTELITGCTLNTNLLSYGQLYVLESMASLAALFIAFGVGLDPRQGEVFGPAYSPVLVGLTVAFIDFGTSFVVTGWYGASLNPARCLGLMSANLDLHAHWIHWLAALTASSVNGVMYALIPPYHDKVV